MYINCFCYFDLECIMLYSLNQNIWKPSVLHPYAFSFFFAINYYMYMLHFGEESFNLLETGNFYTCWHYYHYFLHSNMTIFSFSVNTCILIMTKILWYISVSVTVSLQAYKIYTVVRRLTNFVYMYMYAAYVIKAI